MAKGNNSKPAKTAPKSSGKGAQSRLARLPFPPVTLEDALQIPDVIKEKNGGNPWTPDQVAAAVGLSRASHDFYRLTAAARDFGLTIGTRDSEKIEIAPLGQEIVYAPNPEVEQAKKQEAFLRIELFKKVLEYYKGSDLPEMKYLGNTLQREFGLETDRHEEFSRLFRENCKYLGIQSGFSIPSAGGSDGQRRIEPESPRPTTVILAEPAQESSSIAFVILPFVERETSHPKGFFQEVLRSLITPAARDAGFIVKTANRQGSDVIQSTIINDLIEADLIIADLTEHNPNVLFELGVRMANDKPIALIKASGTGRIFDVDNLLRVYEYNSCLWTTTIEKDRKALTEHLTGAWETRQSEQTYMKILRRAAQAAST